MLGLECADRRKRHGLQDDDSCALCSQSPEEIDHLVVGCPISREVWFRFFCRFGWGAMAPNVQHHNLVDWWGSARKNIHKEQRHCFDTVVILTCWMLWKERNNRTFNRSVRTIDQMLDWVIEETVLWFQAGFRCLEPLVVALGRSPGRALDSM